MAVNENLTVEISTSETIEEFAGPAFENFILLSGPNTMRSMVGNYVNGKGKMEQKTTISYLVQPTKEGTLYIEPAMIKSKGRKYQSQKIAIEVGKAIEGQGGASLAQSNPMAAGKGKHTPRIGSFKPQSVHRRTHNHSIQVYFRMNIGKAMGLRKCQKFILSGHRYIQKTICLKTHPTTVSITRTNFTT